MPKRVREFEESSEQAVKKQGCLKNNNLKIRDIKCLHSEKTINMLFQGALKNRDRVALSALHCSCSLKDQINTKCYYCDQLTCDNCLRPCDICRENFCGKCSHLMYNEKFNCVCYSCLNSTI
ncbi:hypothetical protein HHI36_000267 [Cryptolaemus montrouzieri]|uniref:Apoptosis regulatory protein Siva n=1 Tax=Cryptolaemus montrouzieri TaxID=559131 RepID=A0ABD2P590_9CUCU